VAKPPVNVEKELLATWMDYAAFAVKKSTARHEAIVRSSELKEGPG
jgi:hypothetical protein